MINYTDDVRIFAGCLTGRWSWPTVPAEKVSCNRLAGALAHCEVVLEEVRNDEVRPTLVCRSVAQVSHAPFRGFNRAQGAVLEGAILLSRLHMLPREKIEREVAYLGIAVEKTAGPREQEAWGWLMEKISEFRSRQAGHAA